MPVQSIQGRRFRVLVFFFYPSKGTLTVSLTGSYCALNCEHCNAQYLNRMTTPEKAIKILEENPHKYDSLLISGGSTIEGKIPILNHLDFIKFAHSKGVKLNFHTGLLTKDEIVAIKPYAERVSFDFVYDDNIIQKVYHLKNKTKDDFEKTYLLLRRILGGRIENNLGYPSTRVIPHVTIGLNCGEVTKEDFATIDELAIIKPTLLIIDIFVPTKGTPFENCPVPESKRVLEVIDKAHRKLTKTTLFLGCMRPFGEYRDNIDVSSYKIGVKGFVMPSRALIGQVKTSGEEVINRNECCALI